MPIENLSHALSDVVPMECESVNAAQNAVPCDVPRSHSHAHQTDPKCSAVHSIWVAPSA